MTIEKLLNLNILEILGAENEPEEKQTEILKQAVGAVLNRVVGRVAEELPEERRKEFLDLFEKENPQEKTKRFIEQHVPNFEELFLEELLLFKKGVLEGTQTQ